MSLLRVLAAAREHWPAARSRYRKHLPLLAAVLAFLAVRRLTR